MVRCIVGHILVIVEREMDCQNTRDNGGTELAFLEYLAITAVNMDGLL